MQAEEEEEEEEEPIQTKLADGTQLQRKQEELIYAKQGPGQIPRATPDLQSRLQSLKGGGQQLPKSVRSFFESRFGYDFSGVRVHTDSRAAETAKAVSATAFTTGKDVVFGAGEYAPEASTGKRLLAHELTHVVQQADGARSGASLEGRYPALLSACSAYPSPCIQRSNGGGSGGSSLTSGSASGGSASGAVATGPCGVGNSCSADQCAEIRPALDLARELVSRAKSDLAPARRGGSLSEQTRRALLWHFRTESRSDIERIWNKFDEIERRLNTGVSIFTCNDPARHCRLGPIPIIGIIPAAVAYTYHGTSRPITLCSPFFWSGRRSQATTIIHEAGHNMGLPRAPLERDVYISGHEYRALSSEQALVTTDAYANFARDNRFGASISVSLLPELGTGLAITGGQPQFALSYGFSVELGHPALRIVYPVAGLEFTYVPEIDESSARILGSASIGARIAPRGRRFYFDVRAGGFIGTERGAGSLAGVMTEVSAHLQPGQFDIGLFWRNYHNLLEGLEGTTVLGVSAGMSF